MGRDPVTQDLEDSVGWESYYTGTRPYEGLGYYLLSLMPCSVELSYECSSKAPIAEHCIRPSFSCPVAPRLIPVLRDALTADPSSPLWQRMDDVQDLKTKDLFLILRPAYHCGSSSWIAPAMACGDNAPEGTYYDGANCLIRVVYDMLGWPQVIVTTLPGVKLQCGDTLRACWDSGKQWLGSYLSEFTRVSGGSEFPLSGENLSKSVHPQLMTSVLNVVETTPSLTVIPPLELCARCISPVIFDVGIREKTILNLLNYLDRSYGIIGEKCKLCGHVYHRRCLPTKCSNGKTTQPCFDCVRQIQTIGRVESADEEIDREELDEVDTGLKIAVDMDDPGEHDLPPCYRCVAQWLSQLIDLGKQSRQKLALISDVCRRILPTARLGIHCRLVLGHNESPWICFGDDCDGSMWMRYLAARNISLLKSLRTVKEVVRTMNDDKEGSNACQISEETLKWIAVQPMNTNMKILNDAGVESVLKRMFKGPSALMSHVLRSPEDRIKHDEVIKLAIFGSTSQLMIAREMKDALQRISSDSLRMVLDVTKSSHPFNQEFLAMRLDMINEMVLGDTVDLPASGDSSKRECSTTGFQKIDPKQNSVSIQWRKTLLKRKKHSYSPDIRSMLNAEVASLGPLSKGVSWDPDECFLVVVHLTKHYTIVSSVLHMLESEDQFRRLQRELVDSPHVFKDQVRKSLATLISQGVVLRAKSLELLRNKLSTLWLLYDGSNRHESLLKDIPCTSPHPGTSRMRLPPEALHRWIGGRYGLGSMSCDIPNMRISHMWFNSAYRFTFDSPSKQSFWLTYAKASIHRFFCVEQALFYLKEASREAAKQFDEEIGATGAVTISVPANRIYCGPSATVATDDQMNELEDHRDSDSSVFPSFIPVSPLELMGYSDSMDVVHSEVSDCTIANESSTFTFDDFDQLKDSIKWCVAYWKTLFQACRELCHETTQKLDDEKVRMRGKFKRVLFGLASKDEPDEASTSVVDAPSLAHHDIDVNAVRKESKRVNEIYEVLLSSLEANFSPSVMDARDPNDENDFDEFDAAQGGRQKEATDLIVDTGQHSGIEYRILGNTETSEILDERNGGRFTVPSSSRVGRCHKKVEKSVNRTCAADAVVDEEQLMNGTVDVADWPPASLSMTAQFSLIREATILWRKRIPPCPCQVSLFYREAQQHNDLFRIRIVAKYADQQSAKTFVIKKWSEPSFMKSLEWTLQHLEVFPLLPRMTERDMLVAELNVLGSVRSTCASLKQLLSEARAAARPLSFARKIPQNKKKGARKKNVPDAGGRHEVPLTEASLPPSRERPKRNIRARKVEDATDSSNASDSTTAMKRFDVTQSNSNSCDGDPISDSIAPHNTQSI
eukprot:GHVH01004506.1.p1 GENE.GHVH01004506.1~~GHVH01004506.1.p1  ORF type:complete len:1351 (+),score=229.18 GHVH01004506.1:1218-5270(+)